MKASLIICVLILSACHKPKFECLDEGQRASMIEAYQQCLIRNDPVIFNVRSRCEYYALIKHCTVIYEGDH